MYHFLNHLPGLDLPRQTVYRLRKGQGRLSVLVAALREATIAVGEQAGRKLAGAQAPIRVAVTGRTVGPPLFESLEVLGREEVLRRLRGALERARAR